MIRNSRPRKAEQATKRIPTEGRSCYDSRSVLVFRPGAYLTGWRMPHRPLTDRDMALITVLCQDRETRCEERAGAAAQAGDKEREERALADLSRYRSLRFKMFSAA